jgi:hypothetical protein
MGLSTAIAKRVGGAAAGPALDEVANRFAEITRSALDTVVRTRAPMIAAEADIFRLLHPDLDQARLERAIIRARSRRGGATGVASGLPSMVVGPGTVVEVAAAFADAAAVTYAEVSLILALAHLRGRDIRDIESRRLDVLLSIGIQTGVVEIKDGMLRSGEHVLDPAKLDDLPDEVVGRINRELGDRVGMKFARRRAIALAGRMMPLGIGVAVAGVEDFRSVGSAGGAARKYFDLVETARAA